MDIAKIRKKALSKDAGEQKPGEKPVSGPAEDENREDKKEQAVVEEKGAPAGRNACRRNCGQVIGQ